MLSGGGDSGLLVWLRLVLGRTGALIRVCPPFVQNESFCKSGIFFFPFPMSCLGKNQRQIHPIQSAAVLRVRKPQRSIRRVTQWGPLPARRGRTAWARRSAWGTTKAASVPAYSLQQSADIIFVSFVLKMLGCLLLALLFPGRASLSNVMSHTFILYFIFLKSRFLSWQKSDICLSLAFFFFKKKQTQLSPVPPISLNWQDFSWWLNKTSHSLNVLMAEPGSCQECSDKCGWAGPAACCSRQVLVSHRSARCPRSSS